VVFKNILDAVGNTPMVELCNMTGPEDARILAKFEGLNVGGSIKTRTALNMIEQAEIIREKGTNRSQFLRGQVDKYTWVEYGSSYLPSDMNAAYLWAQLEQAEKAAPSSGQDA